MKYYSLLFSRPSMVHPSEEQHIGYLLKQVAHLSHGVYNQKLEKAGVSVSQDSVLSLLYQSDGMTQKELQQALYIQASSLTKLIDILEKKALVMRIAHHEDARSKLIVLTDAGKALEGQLWLEKETAEQEITQCLLPDEKMVLANLLQRLRAGLTK